jgi:hypothetical protein
MRQGFLGRDRLSEGSWLFCDPASGQVLSTIDYEVSTMDWDHPEMRLRHKPAKSGEPVEYRVRLQTTEPAWGGVRWWFTCPLVCDGLPCERRVQKLFLPPGRRYFGCRHCYDLTYESRRHNVYNRLLFKIQAIRRRLGGSADLTEPFPEKPRGMWWKTYRRLRAQCAFVETRTDDVFNQWMKHTERMEKPHKH